VTFSALPMIDTFNRSLVALSVLIAVFSSYAALDLVGRIRVAHGVARHLWLIGGAVTMGIGIWSMHYLGMLAFELPVPVQYDWPTVAASLLAAIIGLDGNKLVAVNPAYQKMLGCTAEEMQTVAILDELTHPDDREADKQIFLGILAARKDIAFMDKHYVLRDSREVLVSLSLTVLRDATGIAQCILAMATDVTERTLTEAQLRSAKNRPTPPMWHRPQVILIAQRQLCALLR
jgi:PAS domain S-box-containing protein